MSAPYPKVLPVRFVAGLHLKFICSHRCDAPRAIRLLVEQSGGELVALHTFGTHRWNVVYHMTIIPGSLDAACAIFEQLGDFGSVSFRPQLHA